MPLSAPSSPFNPLIVVDVSSRLKECKKPRYAVHCDIPPSLVAENADFLAIPLTQIYNSILDKNDWPENWKRESVSIIPKCSSS